jgi:hypothetical protein
MMLKRRDHSKYILQMFLLRHEGFLLKLTFNTTFCCENLIFTDIPL